MKWLGKAFHLAPATEWMGNVCGKVANTKRGAFLRRIVRDAHIVSVCAFRLRASLPRREKMACDMDRSFGLSYYEMVTNELRNTSPSGSRSRIEAPVEIVGTSRSEAAPSKKRNATEMDDMVDEYVNQRVAKNVISLYTLRSFSSERGDRSWRMELMGRKFCKRCGRLYTTMRTQNNSLTHSLTSHVSRLFTLKQHF